jgi:hypothetical protein
LNHTQSAVTIATIKITAATTTTTTTTARQSISSPSATTTPLFRTILKRL